MAYTKTAWVNNTVPDIDATNLNKQEEGILDAHLLAPADYVFTTDGTTVYARPSSSAFAEYSGTDGGAVLQSVFGALGTSAGDICFTRGNYPWSTIPKIPAGITRKLTIRGSGGTIITLSSVGYSFLSFDRTADYQTFQNVEVDGFTIDANSISAGNAHVVIGSLDSAGGTAQRTNFKNITVRNVRTTNVQIDRWNIGFYVSHPAADEGTQTSYRDFLIEDCIFDGGAYGVGILGYIGVAGKLNHYIDNIVIRRVKHDRLTVPTGPATNANFHVGSFAFGDKVLISDCVGRNAADVGIEINGMTDAVVENTLIEDANACYILFTNHRAIDKPRSQHAVVRNCTGKRVAAVTVDDGAQFVRGWASGAQFPYGRIVVENSKWYSNTASLTAGQREGEFAKFDGEYQGGLSIRNCDAFIEGINHTLTTGTPPTPTVIYVTASGVRCPIEIKDFNVRCVGTRTAGSTAVSWTGILLDGDLILDFDNIRIYNDITNIAAFTQAGLQIGGVAGSRVRGTISDFRILGMTDVSCRGIYLNTPLTVDRLIIDGADFTDAPASMTDDLALGNAAITNKHLVWAEKTRWRTIPKTRVTADLTAFSAGTSTTQWKGDVSSVTDRLGFPGMLHLTAGTSITEVRHSKDGTNYVTVHTQAAAALPTNGIYLYSIEVGDYIQIVGTGSPTLPTAHVYPER